MNFVTLPYLLFMYSTSNGKGFSPLVTAAHEISPTCSCMLNPTLSVVFDVRGVEIHNIECIDYCTKDQSNVKGVEESYEQKCVCMFFSYL